MDLAISQGKNINKSYSPSFSGNMAAKAFELVGGDGVFKNCKRMDVEALKAYIGSMPFKMGVTADEVAALSKFDGVEFLEQSYIFLCKKMGIPDELRPAAYCGKINGDAILGYQPMNNNIAIDVEKLNNLKPNKNSIFSAIRHELQHAMQYYSILRHEELGPKAVEVAADIFADNLKVGAQAILKQMSCEDAEKYCLALEDHVSYEAIQFVKKGDLDGLDNYAKSVATQIKEHVAKLRENILKHYAPIKKDSTLTPKLAKFFEEIHGRPYYKDDLHISLDKWFDASIEEDAMLAQMRADFEFCQLGCFIKYVNDDLSRMIQSGEADKVVAQIRADREADKAAEAMKKAAKE